jgi:hypothetical protein
MLFLIAKAPAGKQQFRTDVMMSCNSIGIQFLRNSSAQPHYVTRQRIVPTVTLL